MPGGGHCFGNENARIVAEMFTHAGDKVSHREWEIGGSLATCPKSAKWIIVDCQNIKLIKYLNTVFIANIVPL
jgi:hypothetical protein